MRGFFYGNWFIGLCAVALGIEGALQQQMPLNGLWYHALVFVACVLFYNHAYRGPVNAPGMNDRSRWYSVHRRTQRRVQVVLAVLLVAGVAASIEVHRNVLVATTALQWLLFLVFPLVAVAYYGSGAVALRNVGWAKPFVLGFVWAGIVTVQPVLVYATVSGVQLPDAGLMARLFLKNLMFIALLAVLFDIKDHAGDHRNALRTFVVQLGLRTTLFWIVLPFTLMGLVAFIGYGALHHFSAMKLLLNTIPFLALVVVIGTLRKRRPVLYYLVVVDGLMLLKAICGSVAMYWF